MSKYIVDILDKDKYALEIGITKNGSPASQRVLDAVKVGIPYVERAHGELIPCSERLPEHPGTYLVSATVNGLSGEQMLLSYTNTYGWEQKAYVSKVEAWMPLPERFKDGDEDE